MPSSDQKSQPHTLADQLRRLIETPSTVGPHLERAIAFTADLDRRLPMLRRGNNHYAKREAGH